MALYIGLDIGGTKFMVASSAGDGKIIHRIKENTPISFEMGIELLHTMVAKVAGERSITAIGAAIGGPLNYKTGIVSPLHQPEWRDVPLNEIMVNKWQCPFYVDVDTNVAALGEYHLCNEKVDRFLYITLSTGVGGGFILNGKVYRGINDGHPEIGHQSINFKCSYPANVYCECGAPDCIEALISGNGIKRIYNKPATELNETEWQEVTYNAGQAIRNLITIYAPDVITLGGGIIKERGQKLVAGISQVLQKNLKLVPSPHIRISKLDYDTALIGALYIAQHGLK